MVNEDQQACHNTYNVYVDMHKGDYCVRYVATFVLTSRTLQIIGGREQTSREGKKERIINTLLVFYCRLLLLLVSSLHTVLNHGIWRLYSYFKL